MSSQDLFEQCCDCFLIFEPVKPLLVRTQVLLVDQSRHLPSFFINNVDPRTVCGTSRSCRVDGTRISDPTLRSAEAYPSRGSAILQAMTTHQLRYEDLTDDDFTPDADVAVVDSWEQVPH